MSNLVEVGDDFVQQPQAFHPLIISVQFDVKFMIICDAREDNAHSMVRLMVQIL